jgi:predicted metal-dependent hydrolase
MPRRTPAADPGQMSLFDPPAATACQPLSVDLPPCVDAPALDGRAGAPSPIFRHPRAQREIRLQEHLVAYEYRRARRRSIGFVIGSDGLSVSAPRWVAAGEVESALQAKAGWILRKLHDQQERSLQLEAGRVRWRDGVELPFLGAPLRVVLDPQATGAVLREGADTGAPARALHVGLQQGAEPEQIRDMVQSWLQRQARRIFEARCQHFAPRLGVRVKRLSLSSAATRWGSASADGSIRLNWRLVHYGMPSIDYVVAHELAHLREMNHSAAFWEVVRSVVPDFETARGTLRTEPPPVLD